jgi:hypothetical protein
VIILCLGLWSVPSPQSFLKKLWLSSRMWLAEEHISSFLTDGLSVKCVLRAAWKVMYPDTDVIRSTSVCGSLTADSCHARFRHSCRRDFLGRAYWSRDIFFAIGAVREEALFRIEEPNILGYNAVCCVERHFGGTCRLSLQSRRLSQSVNQRETCSNATSFLPGIWRRYDHPKRRLTFIILHDVVFQKTGLFVNTAMRTRNPKLF